MCIKRVFSAKYRVLAHYRRFLLKNAFKRRETLVLALFSLFLHNSMHLHHSQCVHCVKHDNVQKKTRFLRGITRFLRGITRFSALTSCLLKNSFKRRETLVLALVSLFLHNSMHLHHSQCFHCVKHDNVQKRVFSALTSFLLKNLFIRKETLLLASVSLILHHSMHLHHSQCFHCVKHDNVHKTRFLREITRFSALTSFLLKNSFKRRETLVLALVSLFLHNSMHLHHSQCFHCVKTQ